MLNYCIYNILLAYLFHIYLFIYLFLYFKQTPSVVFTALGVYLLIKDERPPIHLFRSDSEREGEEEEEEGSQRR